MADIEDRIENLISRIVEFGTASDSQLKRACIRAAKVVGNYSPYATSDIAKRMKRHVSTIENWAHAGCLFLDLRTKPDYRYWSQRLWKELPASHWWLAWEIQNSGYDAMHYLNLAYGHKWSGRDMMQEYRKDMEAGNAPLQFSRAKIAFRGLAMELRKKWDDLTVYQRAALNNVMEAFSDEQ